MAKTKIVQAPPAPVAPPASPRALQIVLTALGELLVAGLVVAGAAVVINWLIVGIDVRNRMASRPPPPPYERVDRIDRPAWRCWWDSRYQARLCEQVPMSAAPRRYPARYGA
jgi:hypothetical protein